MNKDSKIYVAGHRGMVGSAIVRKLKELGYNNLILKTRKELDLTNQIQVSQFFNLENSFVIGFVFRNQLRKSVPNLLEGFSIFKKRSEKFICIGKIISIVFDVTQAELN